jgi:hypothetical protein
MFNEFDKETVFDRMEEWLRNRLTLPVESAE